MRHRRHPGFDVVTEMEKGRGLRGNGLFTENEVTVAPH